MGLVGEGVVYALVGVLALRVAAGNRGARADHVGAVEYVARQPFGRFLLAALTASLFALAAWRLLDVVTGDPAEGHEGQHRLKYVASGTAYLAIAAVSLVVTLANWGAASDRAVRRSGSTTSTVFDWPAGRWLVALGGVALLAYAACTVKWHVIDRRFADWLTEPESGWLARLGQVGYAARAAVYAVVAVFLLHGAVTYDPKEAKGLSGALRDLSGEAWGRALIGAVAAGLIAFGVFLAAQSRYRRAT